MASSVAGWRLLVAMALGALAAAAPTVVAANRAGQALVVAECGDCHDARSDGSLDRIAEGRRTPEGWEMLVGRMTLIHKVPFSDENRRALVKYLADSKGLAPAETKDWRYLLERRPDASERFEDKLVGDTCARCHSYARIALQRRTEADWLRLSHFHVGQYPTIEIQNNGRDRDWWDIASKQVPPLLAKLYPLDNAAWIEWQARTWAKPSGTWRLVGHRPGWGNYEGMATVAETAADAYSIQMELRYADGRREQGSGKAIVYTGYEWRGSVKQGDQDVRQVFTLSEDGTQMQGRWYLRDVDTLGGDLRATRTGTKPEILGVVPEYLKAGVTQQLAIHGTGLAGTVDLGPGVQVLRELSRSTETVVVEARVARNAAGGTRQVQVGNTAADALFKVYRHIDILRLVPERGLARVGGNGGTLAAQPMQFEAVGYMAGGKGGKGGKGGGEQRIGVFPAHWSFANANANARLFRDASYAGTLEANGLFVPAPAGPNPKRKFGTNNTGDLTVTATVADGKRRVKATAPLIVTVQRWVDPPLR
ncbi:MAG: quinohemoprotein amine dehydrogenase subunit alpha [Sterolibacterium sp.]